MNRSVGLVSLAASRSVVFLILYVEMGWSLAAVLVLPAENGQWLELMVVRIHDEIGIKRPELLKLSLIGSHSR